MALIYRYDGAKGRDEALKAAQDALEEGKPVVFPTDSVYGIGLAICFSPSPDPLFRIKRRSLDKAIPLLVASADSLLEFGERVPSKAIELAGEYWPGPLTLVVDASRRVPDAFQGADGTVALRMPDSIFALELMLRLGCPLATTSANISGEPAARGFREIDDKLLSQVPVAIDGGVCALGVASTVVKVEGEVCEILRQGAIDLSSI